MAQAYRRRSGQNKPRRGPFRRLPVLTILLLSALPLAGCRLPVREWRWEVSGEARTWLASLGESTGCGVRLRLWAAPRSMWPLPLPASRPLFQGGEPLHLLALVENGGPGTASFDPGRARLRVPGRPPASPPEGRSQGCGATVGAGERAACGFAVTLPRGTNSLDLDLRESVPCDHPGFVFHLSRERGWRWRRVGPGVPGL